MPAGLSERIAGYMGRLGLRFGRLDFLIGDGEPSFLEVNANGQFAWLDEGSEWPLHRAILEAAVDPTSAIGDYEMVHEVDLSEQNANSGLPAGLLATAT